MKNLKLKFQEFMKGRYGADYLSRDMVWLSTALVVLNLLLRNTILLWIAVGIVAISYFRMFSKNFSKRYNENRVYMNLRVRVTRPFKTLFTRIKDFPKYKYLKCPNCNKKMRVPRGKKQIVVTCPSCHHKFDAKS